MAMLPNLYMIIAAVSFFPPGKVLRKSTRSEISPNLQFQGCAQPYILPFRRTPQKWTIDLNLAAYNDPDFNRTSCDLMYIHSGYLYLLIVRQT